MEIGLLALLLSIIYLIRKGWTSPTKEDIEWAESHSDLIEKNS